MAEPLFDPNRAVAVDSTSFNPDRAVAIDEPEKKVFVEGRSQVIGFPDSFTGDEMNYTMATDIDKKPKNSFFGMVEYGQDLASNLAKGFASFPAKMPEYFGQLTREAGETQLVNRQKADVEAAVQNQFILDPGELLGYISRRASEGLQIPERLKNAGDKLIEMNRKFIENTRLEPTEESGAKKVAFDLGSGLSSIGASIGLTFMTKRPDLVAPMFGLIQKGQIYGQARDAGKSPEVASDASTVSGIGEAMLEFVGLHVFFDVIKTSNKFAKVSLRSASQGVQEGSQQLAQEVTTNAYGITQTRFEEIAKRVGYATAIGAVAGVPVSAIVTIAEKQGVIDDLKAEGKTDEEAVAIVTDISEKQIEGGLVDEAAQILENETSQIAVTNEERQKDFDTLNKEIQNAIGNEDQVIQPIAEEGVDGQATVETQEGEDLDPILSALYEEARKYKSPEEFVEAKLKNMKELFLKDTLQRNIDILKEKGIEVKSPEDIITLYHGTSAKGFKGIEKDGLNVNSYLASDKNASKMFAGSSGGKVLEIKIPVSELGFVMPSTMAGTQGVTVVTSMKLRKGEDGIWRISTKEDPNFPIPGLGIMPDKNASEVWKFANDNPPTNKPPVPVGLPQPEPQEPSKTSKEKAAINKSTGVSKPREPKIYTEMQALKLGLRNQARAAERASVAMFKEMESMLRGEVAKATEQGKQAMKDMQAVKDEIVRLVKENLPTSERGKFLTVVSNAKSLRDIASATSRIEAVADDYARKAVISEIKDAVKNAGKSKNIAIEYIKKIKDVVGQIDLVKRQAKTIESLKKTQEFLNEQKANGEDVFLPERVVNQLRLLSAKPLEQVETAQLLNILSDIENLISLGQTKVRVRGEIERLQKERDLDELLKNSKRYDADAPTVRQLPGTQGSMTKNLSRKFKEDYAKASDYARKLNFNLMPMDVIFDMLDNFKAYTGSNFRIFKARIDAGWSRWLDMQDQFKNPIHELANKLDLKAADFELIGIYAVREQTSGTEKLLATGYTEEDINSVSLNDKQMEFYNAIRNKLDEMRPFVEETMRTVYNKPLDKVRNYFPFMTDFEAMSESEIQERFGDKVQQFGQGKRKNVQKGFTEKRKGGDQKVKVNAMQVYEQHIENASYLVSLGKEIKYIGELSKSPRYRQAVGDLGQQVVVNWVDLLARKGRSQEKRLKWLDLARKNVGAATLGFKLSSVLIQPTALMDGAALIGQDAFAGFNRILIDKDARKFIKENFPEIRDRIADDPSYIDYETSGPLNKLQRTGFMPLKALDALTAAGVGFGAYEQNMRSRGLEIDLKNPDKQAVAYAQLIVRRSQSTGMFKDTPAVFNRGEALTGNISINRAFLQFQSFVINRWSVIKHDMYALGIKTNDPKRAARVAFFMLMAAYTEALIRKLSKEAIDFIVDGEFDDDEKEKTINESAVINIAQNVPFVGQVIGALEYGSFPSPTLDAWNKISDRIQAYNKSKRQSTKEKNALLLGVSLFGYGFGVPGTNQALQLIREKNLR